MVYFRFRRTSRSDGAEHPPGGSHCGGDEEERVAEVLSSAVVYSIGPGDKYSICGRGLGTT